MAESPLVRKTGSRIQGRVHYQKGDLAKSVEEFRSRSREDIRVETCPNGPFRGEVSLRTLSLTESPSGSPKVGTRKSQSVADLWVERGTPDSDDGLDTLVPSATLPIDFKAEAATREKSSTPPNSPCDETPSLPARETTIDLLGSKKSRNEILEKFRALTASLAFGGSPRCCNGCRCVAVLARCRTNLLDRYLCLKCIESIAAL